MTDLGYENISFDEKTQRVFFIDTENSIVVDKEKIKSGIPSITLILMLILVFSDNPKDWNSTYYIATFDECGQYGTCLSYHTDMMCNNYHIDFNYYTGE